MRADSHGRSPGPVWDGMLPYPPTDWNASDDDSAALLNFAGAHENLAFMAGNGEAFAVRPGEGRTIDLRDFKMQVLADTASTGGVVSVLEATEPPGFGPPSHVHHDAAEAFYVLEGEYIMEVDGTEVRCPAGSFVFIPLGVRHGFRVGDVPSRKLNFYFPAAMIGYFDDLAAALGRTGVTEDDLDRIAEAHAMEIVGPTSERYVQEQNGSDRS